MHAKEIDSVIGCTPRSLTRWRDAHRVVWLHGMHNTVESDYFENVHFSCIHIWYVHLSTMFYQNFWSKKDNLWLVTISEIYYLFSYLQILRMECHGVVKRSSNLFSSRSMVIAFTACSPSLLSSLLYQLFSAGIIPSHPAVPPSWAPSSTSSFLQVLYNTFTTCSPSLLSSLLYQLFSAGTV